MEFNRIITLLRKERGITQKQAAAELGVSQALLSHYEKGIRECGLDFVVRVADYYDVSCDYLLGRSADRSGLTLTVEEIPNPETAKDSVYKGSVLPTLNKKLIANSLNIIYSLLQECNNKALTTELSSYLSASVYKAFRTLYSANPKNPQGMFAASPKLYSGLCDAVQSIAEANSLCLASGEAVGDGKGLEREKAPALSPEILSEKFPLFSTSLFNLVQNTENKMGLKKQK